MSNNSLSTNVYSLHDLQATLTDGDIELHESVFIQLDRNTITSIINAINRSVVHSYGIIYIDMSSLHTLLRTNGRGSANYYVNRGIEYISSPVRMINHNDRMYITGPDFLSLVQARITYSSGRQKIYLKLIRSLFIKLSDHANIEQLVDLRRERIDLERNRLKHQRIDIGRITQCEFTGIVFTSRNQVDFAHIESVDTNPFRSLDVNNGVIILKEIHRELTNLGIQDFAGMLQFCENNSYSIQWAENIE